MKIAIIGANGRQGSLLVKEALRRGHYVTGIIRTGSVKEVGVTVLRKDLMDLHYDDIKDNDVIIDAFGGWTPKALPMHKTTLMYLADLLSGKPNRLLVVGGAGSLYADATHTTRLMDMPDFPNDFKPLAIAMGAAFDALKTRQDVNWTYLSPSADFVADGPRTGNYRTGGEQEMKNSSGQSTVSYADFAMAMLDEAEQGKHIRQRFTVVSA